MEQLHKDYSPDQLQQLYEKANAKQLLSKTEQKKQLQYIEHIDDMAKRALALQ